MRFTEGRKLFISSIQDGSVVFHLQDLWVWISAVGPYVEGIAATAGFMNTVIDLWKKISSIKYNKPKKYYRAIGAKTIRSLAKVAAQSDGEVDLRIKGSEISLHITPIAAREYLEVIERKPEQGASAIGETEPQPRLSRSAGEALISTVRLICQATPLLQ